jgi:hypothetical protein
VELVDFKTAANRPPTPQHQNQLRLYAEAVRVLGKNPVRLFIHDLDADAGRRAEVPEGKAEVRQFRTELRDWLSAIHEGAFPPHRSSACGPCDFKRLCKSTRRDIHRGSSTR